MTYVLLTRAPLYRGRSPFSHDLHVLSAPLTFVLSQDQTLQLDPSASTAGCRTPCPSEDELRTDSFVPPYSSLLVFLSVGSRSAFALGALALATRTERDPAISRGSLDSVFKDRGERVSRANGGEKLGAPGHLVN